MHTAIIEKQFKQQSKKRIKSDSLADVAFLIGNCRRFYIGDAVLKAYCSAFVDCMIANNCRPPIDVNPIRLAHVTPGILVVCPCSCFLLDNTFVFFTTKEYKFHLSYHILFAVA